MPGWRPFTPGGTWQDERFEDGLHLTIGNLDTDLTLSCSVVVQGSRGQIPPERLFSPYPIPWDQAPPEADWAAEVDRKVTPCRHPSSSDREGQLLAVSR